MLLYRNIFPQLFFSRLPSTWLKNLKCTEHFSKCQTTPLDYIFGHVNKFMWTNSSSSTVELRLKLSNSVQFSLFHLLAVYKITKLSSMYYISLTVMCKCGSMVAKYHDSEDPVTAVPTANINIPLHKNSSFQPVLLQEE